MNLRQWFCSHPHHRRERDANGQLMLVCDGCGKAVPAISRDDADAKVLRKLQSRIGRSRRAIAAAAKAKAAPATVTPIHERRAAK